MKRSMRESTSGFFTLTNRETREKVRGFLFRNEGPHLPP